MDFAIHADTTWEHQATYQFARRWTPWLEKHGVPVVTVGDTSQAARVSTETTDIPAFTLRNKKEAVIIPEDFGAKQLQLELIDTSNATCDSGHCFL